MLLMKLISADAFQLVTQNKDQTKPVKQHATSKKEHKLNHYSKVLNSKHTNISYFILYLILVTAYTCHMP